MIALVALASAAPIVLYDLQGDDGGFVAYGDAGQWEWGEIVDDPGAGFDGSRAWSTGRVTRYLNASTDYLEIPLPALAGLSRPMLSFQHWYDIEPGDAGWLEVDTGNGWTVLEPLYGYPTTGGYTGGTGGWRTAVFDLSGTGDSPGVRLVFQTDLAGVAAGWTIDQVALHDGDVAAPLLSGLTVLGDTDDLEGPYAVTVAAEDDSLVASMALVWRADGVEDRAVMTEVSPGFFAGSIPAQAPDTDVVYWVEGSDGLNTSREPAEGSLGFRVYLPAPTDLVGPAGRVVDTHATLAWTAPEGRNAVLGYEVLRSGVVVATSAGEEAEVALTGRDTFTVRALYQAGAGDASESFTVDSAVPRIAEVSPAEGWPGDRLRVGIYGEYLLLVAGEAEADLGDGVTVEGVEVRDVDSAWLDVAVADDAAAGPRTLALTTGDVQLTAEAAFTVLDAADRPRLTAIAPDSVRQGDTGELRLTVVGALHADPVVDLGEGLLVHAATLDGDALVVRYTVTGSAPLGERPVQVDDGVRILAGVVLEVKDGFAPPARTCGPPVAPGFVGLGAALLVVLRRRVARSPAALGAPSSRPTGAARGRPSP